MNEKKVDLIKNDEYVMQKYTFELFLESMFLVALMSSFISVVQKDGFITIAVHLVLASVSLVMVFIVKRTTQYVELAITIIIIVECIGLPILFFMDGGMFSPVPIWITLNIMFMLLFLKGHKLLIVIMALLVEYSYLFSRIYLHPEITNIPSNRGEIFFDYIYCIGIAIIWILLFVAAQEKLHKSEKERLAQSKDMIGQSGILKSHEINNISNDIRMPMSSIIGIAEFILKEEVNNIVCNEVLNIKNQSYDILSTIDDALAYSKLEAGDTVLYPSEFYVNDFLEGIIDFISDDINNKDLRFITKIDPTIPRILYGDCNHMRQIFIHLLLASISMTSEGRIIFEVGYNREEGSDDIMLICSISDTGSGMEQADVDSVQGQSTTDTSHKSNHLEGVKLKLTLCREYLHLMGGDIDVESIKDIGTSIKFKLKNRIIDEKPMLSIVIASEKKPKVLICAENAERKRNWDTIVAEMGTDITYVYNRYSFEKAVKDTKFDFIFMFRDVYERVNSIIAYYHCEDSIYVVGDYKNVYGDFGKCKLIRLPLTCFKIAKILNEEWQKEEYLIAHNQGSFSARGSRILVIDDSFINLKIAAGIFEKYGVNIDIATSGEEGLKKVAKEEYHLILVDMLMPDMDGKEVLKRIRQIDGEYYKTVPVIALMSEGGESFNENIVLKGFQGNLMKPIKVKSIEECMLKLLPEKYIMRINKKVTADIRKNEFIQEERGLNVNKGLSNIGFNKESYEAILLSYYHENKKKIDRLVGIFKKEELSAFISAVHGIKSTSASVGAMGLSSLARELEYAGKDGDIGFITEKLPLFLKEYQLILEEIEKYLKDNGKLEEDAASQSMPSGEEETLEIDILNDLKDVLNRMDLKACGSILEQMSTTNYGINDNKEINKLKDAF